MHKLKPYSAFFLLLLVALPLVYVTTLQVHEQINRHKMMERLEEEALHTITIPEQELIWVKKGKELLLGNRRFDVKEIVFKNKMIVITGLFDEEEDAIAKKLSSQKSSQQTALLKLWVPIFQSICKNPAVTAPVVELSNIRYADNNHKLLASYLQIVTPPPKA